jgi:phosphopantetheinyl transferase (holo-ACP synthase)
MAKSQLIKRSKEAFVFSNALVKNNLPNAVSLDQYLNTFSKTAKVEFGFFDSSAPDFNKYYPEVSVEDLKPKDDDYYQPLVRALSKVIVNKFGPIDFGDGDVLKKAMPLLLRQSVYPNHEVMVGNELGVVFEVAWQGEQIMDGGIKIPAGINARLRIDGKANPKIVRGMSMEPPSIHSFSVGVTFDWAKSHPKMEDNDFWRGLGTFGKDGKLIRRLVTEIIAFHEISMVPHGADPYAQVINAKGINNADYANRSNTYDKRSLNSFTFSAKDFIKFGHHHDYSKSFSLNLEADKNSTILNDNKTNVKSNNYEQMDEELEQFINSLSGIEGLSLDSSDPSKLNAEVVLAAVKKLAENNTTLSSENATLKSDKSKVETKLSEAETKLTEQEPKVNAYSGVFTATKEAAIKAYTLSMGDKASTEMIEMISKSSSYDTALVYLNQFSSSADEKFAHKCGDCGSTNTSRMTAAEGNQGILDPAKETLEDKDKPKKLSTSEVLQKLQNKKTAFSTSQLHGED